jgi:hypothetical protein
MNVINVHGEKVKIINAVRYHNLKIGNISFDIVEDFIRMGTTLTHPTAYKNNFRVD